MEGAFSRIPHVTAPARLLLVDDVLTTGATASACAAALVDAGATEIHLVTACRSFADRPTGSVSSRVGRGLNILGRCSRPGLWLPGDQPPVVDASRGRNDPRKATVGRRAWSGLEVSPAPFDGRGCESPAPRDPADRGRTTPQASVGSKTRSAGREHLSPGGRSWT